MLMWSEGWDGRISPPCPPKSIRFWGTVGHLSNVNCGGISYSFVQGHRYTTWWTLPSVQSTKQRVNTEEKCAPCFQAKPRSSKAFDLFSLRWKIWYKESRGAHGSQVCDPWGPDLQMALTVKKHKATSMVLNTQEESIAKQFKAVVLNL